jgi:acyl-CoA synthetase (AMP-forming)/AMP-acid ligase II
MAPYIEGLVEALDAAGGRPVLRHGGRDVAGAALLADVHRYARALDGLGIGRGDLVALLAPNSPDAPCATPRTSSGRARCTCRCRRTPSAGPG